MQLAKHDATQTDTQQHSPPAEAHANLTNKLGLCLGDV